MSHDCDCDDCQKTDSRWAPARAAARAKKDDCPRGIHVAKLHSAGPGYSNYVCFACGIPVTGEGAVIKASDEGVPADELKQAEKIAKAMEGL